MTDREKLFRLLLKAFSLHSTIGLDWNDCSLFFPNVKFQEAIDYLLENGVTIREKQKPLTVKEVRAMPDVVWVEWSFGGCEPRIPSTIDIDNIHKIEHYSFTDEMSERLDEYGKTWRCWAEKPTAEERMDAEWLK